MTATGSGLAPLRRFVQAVTRCLDGRPTEPELLPAVRDHLAALIAGDGWLPDAYARPDPSKYCQYLLHCDPLERFSVVSFVWGPGQQTPIHDHRTWGLIGVLRGREIETAYSRDPAGGRLVPGGVTDMHPGTVGAVSPRLGDIHQVRNGLADGTSISIHVYGGNIGAIRRRIYDPATGAASDFVSGYSRADCPNLWMD